jgi:hypothetical protein
MLNDLDWGTTHSKHLRPTLYIHVKCSPGPENTVAAQHSSSCVSLDSSGGISYRLFLLVPSLSGLLRIGWELCQHCALQTVPRDIPAACFSLIFWATFSFSARISVPDMELDFFCEDVWWLGWGMFARLITTAAPRGLGTNLISHFLLVSLTRLVPLVSPSHSDGLTANARDSLGGCERILCLRGYKTEFWRPGRGEEIPERKLKPDIFVSYLRHPNR